MTNISLNYFVVTILLLYIPFHLLEEALGKHLVFTIKDRKVSPGLFTGILFAVVGAGGIYRKDF